MCKHIAAARRFVVSYVPGQRNLEDADSLNENVRSRNAERKKNMYISFC